MYNLKYNNLQFRFVSLYAVKSRGNSLISAQSFFIEPCTKSGHNLSKTVSQYDIKNKHKKAL